MLSIILNSSRQLVLLSAAIFPISIVKDIPDADKESYLKRHSVIDHIESISDNQKDAVRWYIDCGDDDYVYEANSLFQIAMRGKEIPHEFRIHDGGHLCTYWRTSLPAVLEFVSMSFYQDQFWKLIN